MSRLMQIDVEIGSWLDMFKGFSRVQYWKMSEIVMAVEAAKMSIYDSD